MNYWRKLYARSRLHDMTDDELEAVRQDMLAVIVQATNYIAGTEGRPFAEVASREIARQMRESPAKLAEIKGMVCRMPWLAALLVREFPDFEWLKEAAQQEPEPPRKLKPSDDFLHEWNERRDAAEDRWRAIRDEIIKENFPDGITTPLMEKRLNCAPLPNSPGKRIAELIAHSDLHACAHYLGNVHASIGAVLREQLIDDLAEFIAMLGSPDADVPDVAAA